MQTYQRDGFDSTHLIHANLLLRNYSPRARGCTLLMECAWFGETDQFTYRDQPGFPYIMDTLNLWPFVHIGTNQEKLALLATKKHKQGWWAWLLGR
jgi:Protein of unknown function (DUF616)